MMRHLRAVSLALALAYALPSIAQTFQGLDVSESTQKKKKEKKKKKKSVRKKRTQAQGNDEVVQPKASAATSPNGPSNAAVKKEESPEAKSTSKKAEKAAPTMTFEAVDVSGKTADRQRLDAATAQFKAGQYEQAALASYELMQDPKFAELSLEAEYILAKSLYRMGLYHSSLAEFSNILVKGPSTKFFKPSLEWLFFISHKTVNESVILDEIAKYANYEFPEKFRNEFRYLLARYYFVRGRALDRADRKQEADKSFDEVKHIVLSIPPGDPFYPRAKFLEGLVYFRTNNASTAALEDMKEVVRLTRPSAAKTPQQAKQNQEVRELAYMQLARIHYGAKQNRSAIHYYSKIERGNEEWLEALFESSWANYRIGQYEQALGNLVTLASPFFRDEYFPEAMILKAVIYYENCRYREARTILEDFNRLYEPVKDQLEALVNKNMEASEYYNVLGEVQKKNRQNTARKPTDAILERILKLALTDKDLKQTNDSILELESELDSYGTHSDSFKYSGLAKNLMEGLKAQRVALVAKAGIMAKSKLENELAQLKTLLGNGERIRFETTTKEKEFLEQQLASGASAQIVKKYKYSVAVPDDQLYWPFEGGEYWRDELGTYQYTLTKGCIDRDTANRSVSASSN